MISSFRPPRVHAQRKFAQGQASPFPSGGVSTNSSPLKKSNGGPSGQQSSGSSTASGPTTKKSKLTSAASSSLPKGECPKTEDFLTFLCLRGTNLCPPEFDVFNRATVPTESNDNQSSGDEDSIEDSKERGALSKKEATPVKKKKISQTASQSQKANLPESLKALKKKYTEQRLVRTAISQKLDSKQRESKESVKESVKARQALRSAKEAKQMVTRNSSDSDKGSSKASGSTAAPGDKAKKAVVVAGQRRGLRSSRPTRGSTMNGPRQLRSAGTARRPSAATVVAKKKRRMATLTAASKDQQSNVSRKHLSMLARLTPRGTKPSAFVKKAKKMPLEGKSLRGRNVSVSSEEEQEESEEEKDFKDKKEVEKLPAKEVKKPDAEAKKPSNEAKKPLNEVKKPSVEVKKPESVKKEPAGRQMVCRKTASNVIKSDDSDYEDEVEEVQEVLEVHEEKPLKPLETSKVVSPASKRPGRKSKDSATVYLNMVAQKLNTQKAKSDDEISVESLSEATQEKRLEEVQAAAAALTSAALATSIVSNQFKPVQQTSTSEPAPTITPTPSLTPAGKVDLKSIRKPKYKVREVIKPSTPIPPPAAIVAGAVAAQKSKQVNLNKNSNGNSDDSRDSDLKKVSNKSISKMEKKAEKKEKTKNALKEMQDRLLEEAKKKISCLPEAAPLVPQTTAGCAAGAPENDNKKPIENKTVINLPVTSSGEVDRIAMGAIMAQRPGYIQVKSRTSTDQDEAQTHAGTPVGSIGPQRRLSNQMLLGSSTPPRKILPKEPLETATVAPNTTGNGNNPVGQHLPIGVVGAALSGVRPSSRPMTPMTVMTPMKGVEGQVTNPGAPSQVIIFQNTFFVIFV
jgi:hypothetical protein